MRLLLDSHLPLALADQLRRHGIDAVSLTDWAFGGYRDAADYQILAVAFGERRTLVTYDSRSIPSLLLELAQVGQHHAGVILVDDKTMRPDDIGGLLRAILKLVEARGGEDWEDLVVHLERP